MPITPVSKPHLRTCVRPVTAPARRTHTSVIAPANLDEKFDGATTPGSRSKAASLHPADGAVAQPTPRGLPARRQAAALRPAGLPVSTVRRGTPSAAPTAASSAHMPAHSDPGSKGVGLLIKQTLCRLATLVEASATAAGIAHAIALLFETAFVPALKNFSIAARQRAVVFLVNAVQTIKSLAAKHPVLIAALAACVAKLVRALTAAAAPSPVPLEHTALTAEHRLETPRLPPSPAPAPEDPYQHYESHTKVLSPHATLRHIISKIPSSPAALDAEKAKYLRALNLAERFHAEPILEGRVLDINTLSEWIVSGMTTHTGQTESQVDREASPAEHDPYEHDRPWLDDGPWLDDNS